MTSYYFMKTRLSIFTILCFSLVCAAPAVAQQDASKPHFVLLCLAAHPDDEDGATLAYYKDSFGLKTYTVFLTRGEGGQNEIGPALYKDLAIIRTGEAENASAIVGSQPYFLNFPDFGYSKTAEETYKKWGGRDEVLRRLVYVIRALKPDVIISNHHTWLDDGENHGNHQVAALAALEAFDAAADPRFHPEQFNTPGIAPWQTKKLFFRMFDYDTSMSKANNKFIGYSSMPDVAIPIGTMDPVKGERFVEIANVALREHKTQGMQYFKSKIDTNERIWYKLMQADENYPTLRTNLFSGLVPTNTDTGKITLPSEFTMYDYLDAEQPNNFPPPQVKVARGLSIGIVQTYDSTFAQSLALLKIKYTLLDSNTLADGELAKYSTILVDIRGYGKRPDLAKHYTQLLDYVKNGGNLVVFYQKTFDWKPEYSPYPLQITRNRVTYEDVPVTELLQKNKIFHFPNEIVNGDWDGWTAERGLYYPAPSKDYLELLSMGDPGEAPLRTGLLMANYGSGTYWYCSLSLYRQLQLNHEGAFKLFANLVSYNK